MRVNLRHFPSLLHEEVMVTWLAAGNDAAVVSRESALDPHERSDVVPDGVFLRALRTRRYLMSITLGMCFHTTTHPLITGVVEPRDGIALAAPKRTILDVAETGSGLEQVVHATVAGRLDANSGDSTLARAVN